MPRANLEYSQERWTRACRKLGLDVVKNRGKGGHHLVKNPKNSKNKFTIFSHQYRIAGVKIFNKLKAWGFTEEQIFKALK